MNIEIITDMLSGLSDNSRNSAYDYIRYLWEREGPQRQERAREAFEQVDAMIGDNKGWDSEEDMIRDLAEFRRSRMRT